VYLAKFFFCLYGVATISGLLKIGKVYYASGKRVMAKCTNKVYLYGVATISGLLKIGHPIQIHFGHPIQIHFARYTCITNTLCETHLTLCEIHFAISDGKDTLRQRHFARYTLPSVMAKTLCDKDTLRDTLCHQ